MIISSVSSEIPFPIRDERTSDMPEVVILGVVDEPCPCCMAVLTCLFFLEVEVFLLQDVSSPEDTKVGLASMERLIFHVLCCCEFFELLPKQTERWKCIELFSTPI